ncbi:uncharacterized protein A4U43_C03F9160 [Asparagus officinalis]|uniref:SBP-type domain-containing protein n=1 Tax=Asparagus officinalis TaxID=4686 RepID=A0A5P1F937_ASPOF|nr:squamosa promoter-binding-like protein 8 [Asparagus officinalis]ONK74692.1 uncharacterized protein A4U43_C03F9160 [Asparagus officinalis]
MLEYEWGNPAAAAAAMLLFGEELGSYQSHPDQVQHHHHQVFDNFDHGLGMDFFHQQPQPQQISAAALLTTAAMTPAPARIGLNLGGRTYFSSGSREEEMMMMAAAGRVCGRRRTRTARCQAEGCGADLTHAKHYHRRHKVCEFHSKASIVIAAGLSQRFCQQCSRFHVLAEFDQGKRSCRKRLADHNRRRRKSQDLSTAIATTPTPTINSQNSNNSSTDHKPVMITETKPDTISSLTNTSSPPQPPKNISAPPMVLGLGCGRLPSAATGSRLFIDRIIAPPECVISAHSRSFVGMNTG